MDKLREILESLHQQGYDGGYVKDNVDQALKEIDAYYKSKVPKKYDYMGDFTEYRKGWNACVADFQKERI